MLATLPVSHQSQKNPKKGMIVMAAVQNSLSPNQNGKGHHGFSTEEGGARSRAQANRSESSCKVAGSIAGYHQVTPRDLERFRKSFRVRNDYDAWLIDELGVAINRLDSCHKRERRAREEARRRASECWEQDQELAAVELSEKLHRYPQRISKQLEQTAQGATWKIERWKVLGHVLKAQGTWNEIEVARAWNLLGIPLGENGPDAVAGADTILSIRKPLVEGEIARLTRLRRDVLGPRDER